MGVDPEEGQLWVGGGFRLGTVLKCYQFIG